MVMFLVTGMLGQFTSSLKGLVGPVYDYINYIIN